MLWLIIFVVVIGLVMYSLYLTKDKWIVPSHPKGHDLYVISCNNPGKKGVVTIVRGRVFDGDLLNIKRITHDNRGEHLAVGIRPGSGAGTLRVKNGSFDEGDTLRVESY